MTVWLWLAFLLLVFLFLAIDLGVFHRKAHIVGMKEALTWTAVWVVMALCFNVAIYFIYEHQVLGIGLGTHDARTGGQAALQFLTGYLIEKSLSLDNIFVMSVIFSYFDVPAILQHRVLFWGILGALVMRGVMILAGTAVLHTFSWTVYIFGGLLFITAIKMLLVQEGNIEPDKSWVVRVARRLYPVSSKYEGQKFFVRADGRRMMTPLFLVLLVIESTDLLFAVDSIPAIFAITLDPFIVFTSNIFAILGLRSLYFALAALVEKFRYLKLSLDFVLAFVGIKMMLSHHHTIPTAFSLATIAGILTLGIVGSLYAERKVKVVSPFRDDEGEGGA